MPSPRVSVLLPARDAADTVAEAVGSLLDGDYRDLEVIAIDDGSVDDTGARLEELASADRRVRVLHLPSPHGIVAALRAGHAAAAGELIARQDADDRSAPDRLRRTVAMLDDDARLGAAGCGIRGEPDALVSDGMRRYEAWQNGLLGSDEIAANAFVECPVTHATLVIRRPLLERVGGWREAGWAEDYDLFCRLLVVSRARLGKVAAPLYFWRERPGRLTRTDLAYSDEAFHRARVHYLTRYPLRDADRATLWGTGKLLQRWQASLKDAGLALDVTAINPRRLRHGRRDIPPERLPPVPRRPGDGPLLIALGTARSRQLVGDALTAAGRRAGIDFYMLG